WPYNNFNFSTSSNVALYILLNLLLESDNCTNKPFSFEKYFFTSLHDLFELISRIFIPLGNFLLYLTKVELYGFLTIKYVKNFSCTSLNGEPEFDQSSILAKNILFSFVLGKFLQPSYESEFKKVSGIKNA